MQDYEHELAAIRECLKQNPIGMSVTDISKALNKNKNTIGRYLDILLISGQVEMRTYGMAKVYTLSRRVPLSAMLSYSNDLIMVLDLEWRIIEINENFLHLLGLSRKETIGQNIRYLSLPDAAVHDFIAALSPGREARDETVSLHRQDGQERFFRQRKIPTVFDDGGRGVTFVLEDITERILAERSLRGSEERFRLMAENIQDGLIIGENGNIVYANRRVSEITGFSREELAGMSSSDLISREDYAKIEKIVHETRPGSGEAGQFTIWILRKDGSRRHILGRVTAAMRGEMTSTYITLTEIPEPDTGILPAEGDDPKRKKK